MTRKKAVFYTTKNGKQPVAKWQKKLDPVTRARIVRRVMKAEEGHYGQHKVLTNASGIIEFIFDFGAGYRLYLAEDGDQLIVLLLGGDKSTQDKDIQKAIEYWNDYLSRKEVQ